MAKIPLTPKKDESWQSEYLKMIEDCENRESQLTDWERNFMESVRARMENNQGLTDGQTEQLDTIWERVTKRG